MGSTVVRENEREFNRVDWGKTENLFGPENVGAKYLKINITEYAPGSEHALHRLPHVALDVGQRLPGALGEDFVEVRSELEDLFGLDLDVA